MFASLSFEARLLRKIAAWRMSADSFSVLGLLERIPGMSKAGLSRALNGSRPLPNEVTSRLDHLIQEVDELIEACAPLELNMRNPAQVYSWLVARREGRLEVKFRK